ncbi:GTP:AMP phosphotransferase AK3, mitochondrial isoform X2 [Phymastichus coffea]|uniref:GTP:AMP phosphotransferase AK3, mitochondrial isoform X2 n=1 Tax=Phymastichus coffea TaxID=108790 RepID=UPI00273C50DF|nr:GTP:AMP phosphotransferase AK3, mitochondrial isoform X2 [Phymastichus coffea]
MSFSWPVGVALTLAIACCLHYYVHDDTAPVASPARSEDERQEAAVVRMAGNLRAAALRAVILGAPGSGKGTISARIVDQFSVCHLSSGDKLRQHIANRTALGQEVKKYLDSGSLVPDETMIALISEEIKAVGDRNWLLDGFPRTLSQAEALQRIHPVSLVISMNVPDAVILERLKNRWVHLPSGRVYNIGFNDPKVKGLDDVTGEPLMQRSDDQPEIVQARLDQYAAKTRPVIDYYRELNLLRSFSGQTTDAMWPSIRELVAQYA